MSNFFKPILNICSQIVQQGPSQPCLLCGAHSHGTPLCAGCQADLPRLPARRCPACALPTADGARCGACLKRPPQFQACRAVYRYAFPVDTLVQRLKYAAALPLADFFAGQLAAEVLAFPLPDLILPMPLHPARLGERGFNQAVEIGRALSRRLDVPLHAEGGRRLRDTPSQAGLDLKARRRNLRGAFACATDLQGRRVALLDDVFTSGTSLNELAKAARRAGAAKVEAWVVARTVRA